MKKNGFTLIELMGVVIILSLLGLLLVPTVDKVIKDFREKSYQTQIQNIALAAKNWALDHQLLLPNTQGDTVLITLGQLKMDSYLDYDVENPITKKMFVNDLKIEITYSNKNYQYKVLEDSASDFFEVYDKNMPAMILNGDVVEYVKLGTSYTDQGVTARNGAGVLLSNVDILYYKDGISTALVDPSSAGVYHILYRTKDADQTMAVIRTVIVR